MAAEPNVTPVRSGGQPKQLRLVRLCSRTLLQLLRSQIGTKPNTPNRPTIMCRFPGRLSDDDSRGHQQQASGKRQGAKIAGGSAPDGAGTPMGI